MAEVKVINQTIQGIHLSIDGQEFGFNKQTGVFKQKTDDGKWRVIDNPSKFLRVVVERRAEQYAIKDRNYRATMAFHDRNPNYQNRRARAAQTGGWSNVEGWK